MTECRECGGMGFIDGRGDRCEGCVGTGLAADAMMLNGLTEAETAATASCAGLSVGEVLPVVAWRARYISEPGMIGHYPWSFQDRERVRQAPGYEYESLTPHATAQAIIAAQVAEIERLKRELAGADELLRISERETFALRDNLTALKAKQVADIDETMRLADSYAQDISRAVGISGTQKFMAAREALRSHLAKDRT